MRLAALLALAAVAAVAASTAAMPEFLGATEPLFLVEPATDADPGVFGAALVEAAARVGLGGGGATVCACTTTVDPSLITFFASCQVLAPSLPWADPNPSYRCSCGPVSLQCPSSGALEQATQSTAFSDLLAQTCTTLTPQSLTPANPQCVNEVVPSALVCGGEFGLATQTNSSRVSRPTRGGTSTTCVVTTIRTECRNDTACPGVAVNCEFVESPFSACSVPCGGGTRTRTINITRHPENGGIECPTELIISEPCNTHLCPVDCQVGEWSAFSNCSDPCGSQGIQTRTRNVTRPAQNGGAPCPPLLETQACNVFPCPVDCQLGEWTNVGSCSVSCGMGLQKQVRTIIVPPNHGGAPCGATEREVPCNPQPCPVDCVVSDWSNFTECSAACGGGHKTRQRFVITPSANGGAACPSELIEQVACNEQPCPVNCVLSNFSEWSACSATCGVGTQTRSRTVLQPERNGGLPCGALVESRPCNASQECIEPPCVLSEWGNWSQCSVSCGAGVRERVRSVINQPHPLATCDALIEVESCNSQPCPVDCVWGNWSDFGECSVSCGGGHQTRTRTIAVHASNGGHQCTGDATESRPCNVQGCPVDCVMSEWSSFSTCSRTCGPGLQQRTRTVLREASNGGVACGMTEEEQDCNQGPCPVDCVLSEWTNYTECDKSCGGGTKIRRRVVLVHPSNGGQLCAPLEEEVPCNTQPCPVDCQLSDWGPFSSCSAPCGEDAIKTRTRTILVTPQYGGHPCGALTEDVSCGLGPCTVDCQLSEFGAWSDCTAACGYQLQYRMRTIVREPLGGGLPCGPLTEARNCSLPPCPDHCEYSSWGPWTTCTAPCGGGIRSRSRTVISAPPGAADACSLASLVDVEPCNAEPCDRNCVVSEFGNWSACTSSCGPGSQERVRTVLEHPLRNGTQCPSLVETRACNQGACPVDCLLSNWTAWTQCSTSCGMGVQRRYRSVLVPASGGGAQCGETMQEIACNIGACPQNCELSEWSAWSNCSASCGPGSRSRFRVVFQSPVAGGDGCGTLEEHESCNSGPCPIDCVLSEFGPFSQCSRPCGGGVETRQRFVLEPAQFGGAPCAALEESRPCNTAPCPVDCRVGTWSAWSDCSASCGGGVQTRSRPVEQPAQYGGQPCPELIESRNCNQGRCPNACVLSGWSNWSDCSATCGAGVMTRTRVLIRDAELGGQCGDLVEEMVCHSQPCPVDAMVSAWGSWSNCTASCNGGLSTRLRTITRPSLNGGRLPSALGQTMECGSVPCGSECQLSEWSEWSDCSAACGGGVQRRSRGVVRHAENGGAPCPNLVEERECNVQTCRPGCTYSEWSAPSNCTAACGTGSRVRTRNVTYTPSATENATLALMNESDAAAYRKQLLSHCGATMEELECNTQPCPQHCKVSPWSEWSACSATCDGGLQVRHRKVEIPQRDGGLLCPHLSETRECNVVPCPQDCQTSPWSRFSPCSTALRCGEGLQRRTRTVLVDSTFGGRACGPLAEDLPCEVRQCPLGCIYSEWTEWSHCSATCGETGRQTRTRRLLNVSAGTSPADCEGEVTQERVCNSQPCPVDCVVSNWSVAGQCNEACGSGMSVSVRSVRVPNSNGGAECGELVASHACNTQPCAPPEVHPIPPPYPLPDRAWMHCVVSPWSEWGPCHFEAEADPCHPCEYVCTRKQRRTRHIVQPASPGGAPCPTNLVEERRCNATQMPHQSCDTVCKSADVAHAYVTAVLDLAPQSRSCWANPKASPSFTNPVRLSVRALEDEQQQQQEALPVNAPQHDKQYAQVVYDDGKLPVNTVATDYVPSQQIYTQVIVE